MFCGTGVMAGASTATLNMSMDGGTTWFPVYDINGAQVQLAAAARRNFIIDMPAGVNLQVVLSAGPTAFTGLLVSL
jgi:hypothetical protein